ncbi:MAG: S8 family serine peptidase, partial [Chloroflexota bacterium]
ALRTARENGIIIFAAAGNYGSAFDANPGTNNRAERSVTLNIPAPSISPDPLPTNFGTTLPAGSEIVARLVIDASVGDRITVTWDDWIDRTDGLRGSSAPADVEDFYVDVRLNPAAYTNLGDNGTDWNLGDDFDTVALFTQGRSERQNLFETPTSTFSLAPSFATTSGGVPELVAANRGCPVSDVPDPDGAPGFASDFDGSCSVIVTIIRTKGDAPVTMRVSVLPIEEEAVDPTRQQITSPTTGQLIYPRIDERPDESIQISNIVFSDNNGVDTAIFGDEDFAGVGASIASHAGTIASPADSPDVLAVGGVCANEATNFALLPTSSQGPIYGLFGDVNPSTNPATARDAKPDILSPSHVSTTFGAADTDACSSALTSLAATDGFGGTSAATAHAAAMTAVLLSNPTYSALHTPNAAGVEAIEDYIFTHSVELPLGNSADGPDYQHGNGFFALGSPNYNVVNTRNEISAPDLIALASDPFQQCDVDGNNIAEGALRFVGQANTSSTQDGSISNPFTTIGAAVAASSVGDCVVVMPGEYVTPIYIENSGVRIYGYDSVTSSQFGATIITVGGQFAYDTQATLNGLEFQQNAGVILDAISNATFSGFSFVHT